MALTTRSNLLKSLQGLRRDAPFGTEALDALGISSALASHYVSRVTRVSHVLKTSTSRGVA